MAIKNINIQKTSKPKKKVVRTVTEAIYGKEPVVPALGIMGKTEIARYCTWLHANVKKQELKKYAHAYLKKLGCDMKPLASGVPDDYWINIGIAARLVERGVQLEYDFKGRYTGLLERAAESVITAPKPVVKSVSADKVCKHYYDIVDTYIDNIMRKVQNSAVLGLDFNGLTGTNKTDMLAYIRMERGFLLDKDLVKEGYDITLKQKDEMIKFFNLVEGFLAQPEKILTPAEQVKNLKYMTHGSIKPTSLIGKKSIVLHNPHTHRTTLLICSGGNKLSVSGGSIKGYDTELSFVKTDRDETWLKMKGMTVGPAKKVFDMLMTTPMRGTGRISDKIQLVKVW